MDTHTHENVKLLLSPRQSRGITYWIQKLRVNKFGHYKVGLAPSTSNPGGLR